MTAHDWRPLSRRLTHSRKIRYECANEGCRATGTANDIEKRINKQCFGRVKA